MEIKIGADPEFFLRRHGELVSAHNMVPGTKENPHKVDGGAIQVDGMALEFNINPATTSEEFVDNIAVVLESFREFLPAKEGWEFDFSPVAHFGEEMIKAQPYEARVLGCDPDYNAYTGNANPKPNGDVPFRTASGHIHVGWTDGEDPHDPEHFEAGQMLSKQLDYTLLTVMRFFDDDTTRRTLYGQPGAFRPKHYGMEYRVLSNAWLKTPEMQKMVFDYTDKATNFLLEGKNYVSSYIRPEQLISNDENDLYNTYDLAYLVTAHMKLPDYSFGSEFWHTIQAKYEELRLESLGRRKKEYPSVKFNLEMLEGLPAMEVVEPEVVAAVVMEGNIHPDWFVPINGGHLVQRPWRGAPVAGF